MEKKNIANLMYNYNFMRIVYFILFLMIMLSISTITGSADVNANPIEQPY